MSRIYKGKGMPRHAMQCLASEAPFQMFFFFSWVGQQFAVIALFVRNKKQFKVLTRIISSRYHLEAVLTRLVSLGYHALECWRRSVPARNCVRSLRDSARP